MAGGCAMRARCADDRIDVAGIERKRALEKLPRFGEIARGMSPVIRTHSLKIEVHRVRTRGPFSAPRLGDDELRVERVSEAGDEFVLPVEEGRHRLVETVRPKMIAALG